MIIISKPVDGAPDIVAVAVAVAVIMYHDHVHDHNGFEHRAGRAGPRDSRSPGRSLNPTAERGRRD